MVHIRNTFSVLTSGLVGIVPIGTIQAQIVPDNTLGNENSSVRSDFIIKNLPSDRIDGGAVRATNLFHSFTEFNVDEGRGAYFTSPAGIENIISRVTGTNPSTILGKLGVINGDANLFLLNSRGIIFGPTSSLDLGGSFLATTASSLIFADGTQLNSKPLETPPLLTISTPVGLGFNDNLGDILVQGEGGGARQTRNLIDTQFGLRVSPERTLALLGGNVLIEGGTIKAPGGSIQIGSVLAPGKVDIRTNDSKNFSFDYANVPTLGAIRLTQQATVDASGLRGGEIQIQGKSLLLADGSQIESSTLTQESGGVLQVNVSDTIEVNGVSTSNRRIIPSGISAFVYPGATGSGANVEITAKKLTLAEGGSISTATLGVGSGGNLAIQVNEIEVIGTLIAGRRAGGIATATAPMAVGNSGNVKINTNRLIVRNGGLVSSTSLGYGTPGDLLVKAQEFVEIVGSANQVTPSSLSARSTSTAASGNITVETQRFSILDGARVNASSSGMGDGGKVTLTARLLQLDKGSIAVETQSGNGGGINLQVQDFLLLQNNSNISATAGIAGGIGDGGNITINTPFILATSEENSDIFANAFEGRGGNINITAKAIYGIQPRSQETSQSDIIASSELGIDGTVQINTLDITPISGLVNLSTEIVDSSRSIAQECPGSGSNLAREKSEFIITGRGGLPPKPTEPLRAEALAIAPNIVKAGEENRLAKVTLTNPTSSTPTQIVEAQGWVINERGQVVLTAQPTPVNTAFTSSRSTQVTCYAR